MIFGSKQLVGFVLSLKILDMAIVVIDLLKKFI